MITFLNRSFASSMSEERADGSDKFKMNNRQQGVLLLIQAWYGIVLAPSPTMAQLYFS
jgi:hypothetical protein